MEGPLRIYLETTVFNYYFDENRDGHPWTKKLFEGIKQGKYKAYTSIFAIDEIMDAPEPKRTNMLSLINNYEITTLDASEEVLRLAGIYINKSSIPENKQYDAMHVAVATINEMDYLLSYNCHHINKVKTKEIVGIVNREEGYQNIVICKSEELIDDEET
jgi:predicted nucleic acid-binding protein